MTQPEQHVPAETPAPPQAQQEQIQAPEPAAEPPGRQIPDSQDVTPKAGQVEAPD